MGRVRAIGLSKGFGGRDTGVVALDDVHAEFGTGEFTAIMGPSGSGKTTLLQCLAGLDRPSAGTVLIDGQDITAMSARALTRLRRDRLGFVFQSFNLIPTLTAAENITLGTRLGGRPVDHGWLRQLVDRLGLAERMSHRPAQLSGGQQQRVAVARALVHRPQVVFADEPTGNLDSRTGGEVLRFLRHAVDSIGQTVVMVTHDPAAAVHTDRVLFLRDGRLVDELRRPTGDSVLSRLAALEALA
jgi:putative ABC transport system ATP-binding protein